MRGKSKWELAEIDYVTGMKYREIAEKYGVSINTVKSWKVALRTLLLPDTQCDSFLPTRVRVHEDGGIGLGL